MRFSGGILHTPAPCHRRLGCVSTMWADWWSSPQVTGTSPDLAHVLSLPTCCVSSQTRGHGAVPGTGCSCRPASVLWLCGEGASFWPREEMVWGTGKEGGRAGKTIQYPERGDRTRSWARFGCRSRTDHSQGPEVATSNAQ